MRSQFASLHLCLAFSFSVQQSTTVDWLLNAEKFRVSFFLRFLSNCCMMNRQAICLRFFAIWLEYIFQVNYITGLTASQIGKNIDNLFISVISSSELP